MLKANNGAGKPCRKVQLGMPEMVKYSVREPRQLSKRRKREATRATEKAVLGKQWKQKQVSFRFQKEIGQCMSNLLSFLSQNLLFRAENE